MVGRFVYGQTYRARRDALPIDEVHLPIARQTYQTTKLRGIFGALRDASPDFWGRRVIERELGRTDLTEIDYLLHSPEDRAGALSFGRGPAPPAPVRTFNRVLQLPELLEAARLLEEEPGVNLPAGLKHIPAIVHPGTSLGGARPKNVVEDEDGLWVAKFPLRDDRWNMAVVEASLLCLARRCGIQTPPTRVEKVLGRDVLLVKRFDREPLVEDGGRRYARHRMVSALTVLDADDSPTEQRNWSYVLLADELRRWSHRDAEDRRELFRRMVFNALVSNTDDHPRNHALIAPGASWQLAPAYDLNPDPMPGTHERDLSMVCGQFGRRAQRINLISQAPRFGLAREEAHGVIDEIVAIVRAEWEAELFRHGGTAADRATIAPAFVDEGFEYEAVEANPSA